MVVSHLSPNEEADTALQAFPLLVFWPTAGFLSRTEDRCEKTAVTCMVHETQEGLVSYLEPQRKEQVEPKYSIYYLQLSLTTHAV